ncbi:hypothetical protein JOE11_004596 [Robbsia andropogonis]|uniref:hypothetical protein n=1 Tax=Robbsia andropogonis TaxID=28092 RepID=UPI003D1EFE46
MPSNDMQVRDTGVQTDWHDPLPGGNASEPGSVTQSAPRDARPSPPAALQGLPSTNSAARQSVDRTSTQRRQSVRASTGDASALPGYARATQSSQNRSAQQLQQIRVRHQRQHSIAAAEAREAREESEAGGEARGSDATPKPRYVSAEVQTGIIPHHDIHNHSIGPGYSHTQIEDFTKTLAQNAYSQLQYFDKAGVKRFVWAPIPTVIVHGKVMLLDPCGNHDHEHDHAHGAGGEGSSSTAAVGSDSTAPQLHGATHADGKPKIATSTYYMNEEYRGGKEMTGEAFDRITSTGVQAYNTSVDWQVGKAHEELAREHPEAAKRIYPSITGVNLADANSVHYVLRLKKEFPNRFFIVGEATSYKEFVDKQNVNYKHIDFSPEAPLNDLLRFLGRAGMPFEWHCDSSDAERCIKEGIPGQGEHRAGIEAMVERHGDTSFIHAHVGGLGKYGPPGDDHEEWIDAMMTKHPHYKVDISWDVVAENYSPHSRLPDNHPGKPADEAARKARIERLATVIRKHPDRFIMGSDALVTRNPESISATYNLYANRPGGGMDPAGKLGLFDYLPPKILTKVLSGNFETVLDKAEADGRRYEAEVMPEDMRSMQAEIVQNSRTPNVWPAV